MFLGYDGRIFSQKGRVEILKENGLISMNIRCRHNRTTFLELTEALIVIGVIILSNDWGGLYLPNGQIKMNATNAREVQPVITFAPHLTRPVVCYHES